LSLAASSSGLFHMHIAAEQNIEPNRHRDYLTGIAIPVKKSL